MLTCGVVVICQLIATMLIFSIFMEFFESLLLELYRVAPCLLLVFLAALFVISGGWIKVFMLLCCVALAYITIKLAAEKLLNGCCGLTQQVAQHHDIPNQNTASYQTL